MSKKEDVTKGLDPDLFEEALTDPEPDKEDATDATDKTSEEESSEEGETEKAESGEETDGESTEKASTEKEESTEPDETDAAMTQPPKRRGRPPKDKDKDDEGVNVATTYEVQRGFTAVGGKTYHPNDVIPIKCKHCALWEREWLGKKRCSPGRRLDEDTTMHADRFSCGTFFICKEYDAELNTFLNMSLPEILTVRAMLPGLKKILQSINFLEDWSERHNNQDDLREIFTNAKGFVMSFNDVEQLKLAEDFIRQYAKIASKRARDKRPPRPKFESGDWVEWTDLKSKERLEGIILSIGRGNIMLAGVKAHSGQKYTYKYKEWKKDRDPAITRKTANPE